MDTTPLSGLVLKRGACGNVREVVGSAARASRGGGGRGGGSRVGDWGGRRKGKRREGEERSGVKHSELETSWSRGVRLRVKMLTIEWMIELLDVLDPLFIPSIAYPATTEQCIRDISRTHTAA
jgi:hypothetical protein